MTIKTTVIVFTLVLAILGGGVYLITRSPKSAYSNLDSFATCLTEKGIAMYGAYWCPHCQNEKKAFGSSFQFVKYVECTVESKTCSDLGIKGYPTWIFPPDRRFEGEMGLPKLSAESGCSLDNSSEN